ncbi:MAG TPA: tail fiber protein [Acidobacteriaceae bacterium]|nr:tail fiber protein [Acidobacteriaceae bacterium]
MSTPYLGEIKLVSFAFAPKGWAFCNGQLLPITQNQALFSLLGTYYGGDGIRNFQLPNLQGASPLHMGTDLSGNGYVQGQAGGATTVTLVEGQLPAHTHQAQGVSTVANLSSPAGNAWAVSPSDPYGTHSTTTMNSKSVALGGDDQPHYNLPPYLVLNFVIALQGIYPSRN